MIAVCFRLGFRWLCNKWKSIIYKCLQISQEIRKKHFTYYSSTPLINGSWRVLSILKDRFQLVFIVLNKKKSLFLNALLIVTHHFRISRNLLYWHNSLKCILKGSLFPKGLISINFSDYISHIWVSNTYIPPQNSCIS